MTSLALLLWILLCLLGGSGCAWKGLHRRPKPATAAAEPSAPQPIFVGIVALVDETGKFVLIDSGRVSGPPAGGLLRTYTGATESGELVTSRVRRHPFAIGDIRSGNPRKGDRVMLEPALPATAVAPANAPQASPALGGAQ